MDGYGSWARFEGLISVRPDALEGLARVQTGRSSDFGLLWLGRLAECAHAANTLTFNAKPPLLLLTHFSHAPM